MCCIWWRATCVHSLMQLTANKVPPMAPLTSSSLPACAAPRQVLYGRSGYLLGCLLLNSQLQPGSVPRAAMQAVVEAIISSGEPCCLPSATCTAAASCHTCPSLPLASCPFAPGTTCSAQRAHGQRCAGWSLAGHLRSQATFPSPLFYMWPPGPDASPYLGAAHGLMGEPACQLAAAPPALLCRRPPVCR
jgi:hypothetical protein